MVKQKPDSGDSDVRESILHLLSGARAASVNTSKTEKKVVSHQSQLEMAVDNWKVNGKAQMSVLKLYRALMRSAALGLSDSELLKIVPKENVQKALGFYSDLIKVVEADIMVMAQAADVAEGQSLVGQTARDAIVEALQVAVKKGDKAEQERLLIELTKL
jgi:hypothetical protein